MPSGLGRGLSSLIPPKITPHNYTDFDLEGKSLSLAGRQQIVYLDPQKIKANPYQPRQVFSESGLNDLVNSIKEHGLLQPLVAVKSGDSYELIAGERRLRSAQILGLKEVPVIVREADKQKKLELALIENLQRENLNPMETAVAYNQLLNEFNLSQEELSLRVGKARSSVANVLRFLNLPGEAQRALSDGRISEAHAKYILGVEGEAKQFIILKKILHNNLSVRDTSEMIKKTGGTKSARVIKDFKDDDRVVRLSQTLGLKVDLRRKAKGGQVVINFSDDEDLDNFIKRF